MTARQIKWRIYWNFIRQVKCLPRKPERALIKNRAAIWERDFEAIARCPIHGPGDKDYLEGVNYWHVRCTCVLGRNQINVGGIPVVVDERMSPDVIHLGPAPPMRDLFIDTSQVHLDEQALIEGARVAGIELVVGSTPCPKCNDTGLVRVHGPEDHGVSFESESCECEIGRSLDRHEAGLCGCGHGDYRTCPCEDDHPSKATGQFDYIADLEACDEDD